MLHLVNVFNFLRTVVSLGISEEEGQGMIEYVLIAALISIVAIGAIVLIGPQITTQWTAIDTALP